MMIPTLVLIYDPQVNKTLSTLDSKFSSLLRVIRLTPLQGMTLYPSPNQTPFVNGAILFDHKGSLFATRKDEYADLESLIETYLSDIPLQAQTLLTKFLNKDL